MKVIRNDLLGIWELAESEEGRRRLTEEGLKDGDSRRILIVDDEESVLFSSCSVLRKAFPECIIDVSQDGAAGFAIFEETHPSIVISDVAMPKMGGEEFFNLIMDFCAQREWKVPAVIFCTGYNPPVSLRRIVAADPAHCLLRKPVRNKLLQEVVRKRLKISGPMTGN